jgi:hypothetical protein
MPEKAPTADAIAYKQYPRFFSIEPEKNPAIFNHRKVMLCGTEQNTTTGESCMKGYGWNRYFSQSWDRLPQEILPHALPL